MKRVFFILFCIPYCLVSCSGNHTLDMKDIPEQKNSVIPDSVYSFFPKKNKYSKMIAYTANAGKMEHPYVPKEFDATRIVKLYNYFNQDTLKSLKQQYTAISINKIKSEENDYFIIGSARVLKKRYSDMELKKMYNESSKDRMILNFNNTLRHGPIIHDSTTICGLSKGHTVLTLKSGNEFILPDEYQYNWDVLPDKIKHGYRSGVAFKEGEPYIIYWVVAW